MATPSENLLDAFEIDITLFGSRFDRKSMLKNLSNIIRSKLRSPSTFPNAKILMKGEKFVIYGVPRADLEVTLSRINSSASAIHGWSFQYVVTPKQLSSGEILDLTYPYIFSLERQLAERDGRISSLETVNADLEKKCGEVTSQAEAARSEIRSLKGRLETPRTSGQALGSVEYVKRIPKIQHANLVDILLAAASLARMADQQIEHYAQVGLNFADGMPEPPRPNKYFEERFKLKGESPADFIEKLTQRYEKGWLRSFTAFRRASKEVFEAMNNYSSYVATYTLLCAFREAGIKIPIFSVGDGQAVHYFVPRGSNKGEFSSSLRDSIMGAAQELGLQASTEKLDHATKISVPRAGAAAMISNINQNPAELWKNLGVQVYVIDLDSAEV
ncbi:MAG: hypothetical protein HY438_04205 [DPANN group archaeon]|nr:hypothetical protein [DPANN group archaeon]